jgi:hypothetical protein
MNNTCGDAQDSAVRAQRITSPKIATANTPVPVTTPAAQTFPSAQHQIGREETGDIHFS